MSVNRSQHAFKTEAVTLVDATATEISLPRPTTTIAGEPGTIDHVSRPSIKDDFRAGKAIVTLPAVFDAGNVFIRELKVVETANPGIPQDTVRDTVTGQDKVVGALFPTGASTANERVIISTSENIFPTNGTQVEALLQNLTVRSDESIVITLFNNSGGNLGPDRIEVHYDFGLNPDIIGLRAIN